jgi:hypothetical protein
MEKKFILKTTVWGFVLWLIGYILGIILFFFVPKSLIGWVITPIGIVITLLVLFKKIKAKSLPEYLTVSVIWTLTAIVLDYFLLVKLFKPTENYYKLDVYFYYVSTFLLPLLVGWRKKS